MRVKFKLGKKDYELKLERKGQTPEGHEIPDPVPMEPPVGFIRQPSMVDNIRQAIRSEALRYYAMSGGMETFEEADDFDIGDDYDPSTPYEADFEPISAVVERARAELVRNEDGLSRPERPQAPAEQATPQAPAGAPSQAPAGPSSSTASE